MMMLMNKEKIGPQHLGRGARVYVRQSTLDQVRHNHESRRRQYELAGRARLFGWTEVEVIDEDLGKSAAGSIRAHRIPTTRGSGRSGTSGSRVSALKFLVWPVTTETGTSFWICVD